jgi:pimeloyl-ACP methyl ester carboxylesterase
MESQSVPMRVRLSTGVELAYLDRGSKKTVPLLMLHAWGESRGAFDRLVPLLADTGRVMAIDQRGHGDAEVPEAGYSLADFSGDVEAFMEATAVSSAILVGVSSGGYVAQQVAVDVPHRVAALVLIGSPRTLQGRPPFAGQVEQLIDPVPESWVRESLTWFPLFHEVPRPYIEDRVRDGARIPAHVWRETFTGLCAATPPTDLGTITAPTLIVCGGRDDLLVREQRDDLARAIPNSTVVTYKDTGHLVLWEQPERLARDLRAFLEDVAPSPQPAS